MIRVCLFACLTFLLACAQAEVRVTPLPASETQERVRISYDSVEIALVTMPSYAASEEVFAAGADGTLIPLGPLWPDDPARAMTLDLSRELAALTGRLVAPEPWPFRDFADVKVDVRVSDFYATAGNTFRLAGQYFIAPDNDARPKARSFAIETLLTAPGTAALAAAQAQATSELAQTIAREGLR